MQADFPNVLSKQSLKQKEDIEQKERNALRKAAEPISVPQALLRLIEQHDLPLFAVEWLGFHTLMYTVNSEAKDCIWTSHHTIANRVAKTFEL